jgi:ornithine carbamoyltransferase
MTSKTVRHFTDLSAISAQDLRFMMDDAKRLKGLQKSGKPDRPFEGKVLAMIFDKPSTRTRVSFDVGMRQLGGETIMLTGSEMQLGRSESIADTAKVLSRYVDIIMIRTTDHARMLELAEHATVPVINGLTDDTHPCQIMADIMTYEEHRGPVKGKTFAWTGDGNNVLHSLAEGAARFGFNLNIACSRRLRAAGALSAMGAEKRRRHSMSVPTRSKPSPASIAWLQIVGSPWGRNPRPVDTTCSCPIRSMMN